MWIQHRMIWTGIDDIGFVVLSVELTKYFNTEWNVDTTV